MMNNNEKDAPAAVLHASHEGDENLGQSSSKRRWRVAMVDVGMAVAMLAMVLVALDLLASSEKELDSVAIVSDSVEKMQLTQSPQGVGDVLSPESVVLAQTTPHLDTVAYIEGNEGRERDLVLVGQGWVEEIAILRIGQRVARGQLLVKIYSPALVDAQLEYLTALENNDAVLMREAIDRLTVYGQTMAQINGLPKKANIDGVMQVFAPSDGMISAVYVETGEFVPMAASLVGLVDMTSIWMVTEISMVDAEGVRPGRRVDASIPQRDGPLVGVVEYVDYPGRQKAGLVTVRLRFDGIKRRLVSRNYADVRIYTGRIVPSAEEDTTS